ncbi:glycosyltransferase [Oscillatoria sp. FACHB-1406]|uniref:glycosyltransferase n=1 Tax=Oscillatoria sp. FACHB-1406 TaxID=2692846 RepID=UPI001682FE48|nr:glycosyltransferase [Oscillatoria sp. FACHB-1406]
MPLISVLISVYNGEKTIRETLESVLAQTFSDFEIVIINDGSTDSTVEAINSLGDSRIHIFSYPNAGLNASRNRAISHAEGEYVSFLDADDLWTPDKLELQLKALQDYPEAAAVYSWTDYIDIESKFLRTGPHHSFQGDVFAKLLLADFIGSGSNPLIRKSAFAEVGDFDTSIKGGQDWDMWVRLARRYPFAVVPSVQILYRQYSTSWSANAQRQEQGCLRIIEKALADAPESVKKLRKDILGNRYKESIIDALGKVAGRDRALLALRYLATAIYYDPRLLRSRILPTLLFTIGTRLILPPDRAQSVLERYPNLSNIYGIFGYIRWSD